MSERSRTIAAIQSKPAIRTELVARIRAEIEAGTYLTEEKLNGAVAHMVDRVERAEQARRRLKVWAA